MKRLFPILALATLVAMSLVSCKPNEVKLHPSVGEIYHANAATATMGGDGIIFYVNEGEGYALVCSMNDLKRDRQNNSNQPHLWEPDFTWSVFGTDTVMEKDTVWAKVTREFKYFVGVNSIDSVPEGSLVNEAETFKIYNYEKRDSAIMIYPMLCYKAYKENGEQVLAPYTTDTMYLGFIGEMLEADTVLASVKVEKFIGDTTWKADTVLIGNRKYGLALNEKFEEGNMTLYRPFSDTVERRTRTYSFVAVGYTDTLWNGIKTGDRRVLKNNEWECLYDTNWSFGLIPDLGENDPRGDVNTDKIVKADVPCRQKVTPDSSSAARTCREYFTRKYVSQRAQFAADTALKGSQGQWFLPSRVELNHLFDARNKINELNANTKGFEPLQNCYWSSNQRNAGNAWYKCFSDNGVESYIPKANNNYRVNIRAVRKVDWPLK